MSLGPKLARIVRSYPFIAALLVGALVLAALPTSNATHIGTGGGDVRIDVTVAQPAHYNGWYLGDVSPVNFPAGLALRANTPYEIVFVNITPSNATMVELVSPNGTVVAPGSPYATGSNASVRNATLLVSASALSAGGVYTLRESGAGGVAKARIYVAPQAIGVSVTPNPVMAPAGASFVVRYTTVPNATLDGPCIPPPARTDSTGNFTAVQSCPGAGVHTVVARKQTSNATSNGVDVPEQEGNGTYSVVNPTPSVRIRNVSGSSVTSVWAPIRLENVSDLGAVTVRLTFDPNVVEALAVGHSSIPGVNVSSSINGSVVTILATTADRPGPTGSFDIAQVELRATGLAGSTSTLDLDVLELVDSNGTAIAHTVVDGSFRSGILGDADGDGDVDAQDVHAIADAVVGSRPMSSIVFADADVSRDGAVTGKDAMMLRQHLAGTRPVL